MDAIFTAELNEIEANIAQLDCEAITRIRNQYYDMLYVQEQVSEELIGRYCFLQYYKQKEVTLWSEDDDNYPTAIEVLKKYSSIQLSADIYFMLAFCANNDNQWCFGSPKNKTLAKYLCQKAIELEPNSYLFLSLAFFNETLGGGSLSALKGEIQDIKDELISKYSNRGIMGDYIIEMALQPLEYAEENKKSSE